MHVYTPRQLKDSLIHQLVLFMRSFKKEFSTLTPIKLICGQVNKYFLSFSLCIAIISTENENENMHNYYNIGKNNYVCFYNPSLLQLMTSLSHASMLDDLNDGIAIIISHLTVTLKLHAVT